MRQQFVLRSIVAAAASVALGGTSACLPYVVGSTARTVPMGEMVHMMNVSIVVGEGEIVGDSSDGSAARGGNIFRTDQELRFGMSDRSDFGVRLVSASGLVLNYKRRHFGPAHPDSAAFASMWGAGFVSLGEHLFFEGTLLRSGRRRGRRVAYAGLRAMHVVPVFAQGIRDEPSIGAFFGLRIGDAKVSVTPELGLWYERSPAGRGRSVLVLVPSVTLTGFSLPSAAPR